MTVLNLCYPSTIYIISLVIRDSVEIYKLQKLALISLSAAFKRKFRTKAEKRYVYRRQSLYKRCSIVGLVMKSPLDMAVCWLGKFNLNDIIHSLASFHTSSFLWRISIIWLVNADIAPILGPKFCIQRFLMNRPLVFTIGQSAFLPTSPTYHTFFIVGLL